MSNELTDVRCPCGDEYPADSYDAGFIAGSGMCQNCDAALPPKDICTCPSGDGSLRHPCPAHPAVEQACWDERDFQAKGAQEVPSPVSKEYDRHLIGLLRKGEALPGHQEEAADEIERLRDWNDHLNNTVLPNILNPNFLMLMKGGERLLDLCTKDGEFIGVSLNDMKDVFDWMVTHARIAPDQAALAQPSPAQAEQHWPKLEKPVQVGAIRFHAGLSSRLVVEAAQRLYEFESTPEKEAERIERLQAFREQCFEPLGTEFSKVLSDNLPDLLSTAQAERPEFDESEREDMARIAFETAMANGISLDSFTFLSNSLAERYERIVGELRADRDSWAEQVEQRLADWDEMRKERDAALAKIAELDQALAEKDPFGAKLNRISEKLERCDALLAARAAQAGQVPQAWLDVQAERRRQVEAEGWTPEHDDEHSHGQMARAAACYALAGSSAPNDGTAALLVSLAWPWDEQWWKPTSTRRDLVKACALALAEIERLDRAAPGKEGNDD
ncbi:hypothetical protein [Pseudomonas aeruginosa]|uniref:hypothetical protein n=1 Tax=Pseudomonas aeruginosa TaxID=287 RepID=UPI001CD4387D|nr:hypothetical protein [Pseudomonas aeruginosa]